MTVRTRVAVASGVTRDDHSRWSRAKDRKHRSKAGIADTMTVLAEPGRQRVAGQR